MLTQEREFDTLESDHFNTVPMSKFNPATWLNHSGLFSDSSADVSTNESLAGVHYASQSSLGSAQINAGGENPSLVATAAGLSNRRAAASSNDRHQHKGNELLRQWKYDESHSLREDTRNSDILNEQPSLPPSQHIRQMSMPIISSSGAIRSTPQNRRPGFSDYQESNPYPAMQSTTDGHYANNFAIEVQSDDDDSGPYPGTHDGLNRNESFGASSCISGLSADETHFDDGRSYKFNGDTNRVHPLLHPRDTRTLQAPKGRDFGDAFDHLILDGQSNDEADNCYRTTNSTGSRRVYHNKNTVRPRHMRVQSNLEYRSNSHPLTKPKHLPAHATLRERITSSNILKPQILQSRSTSNTVHSSSSTSQSAASYVRHGANGRPIENIKIGGRSSSLSSNGGGHSDNDGYHDELALNPGLRRHNELLGNRPRHNIHYQSTNRTLDGYDEKSLQDVPEDDPSTKWHDARSIDGRSILSNASTTQRRRVIKDEIKFIVTKLVPARLRKGKNGSITLERSEGCLT